ncbi:MAG TPA: hypothetical protein VFO65_13755, partial [Acidimicrobiales bacterium]|nr:hypothetical protein [Acidimicrobiales bacterium]
MSDEDVRRMLHRRAEDVAPSPEAWASIEARLDAPAPEPSRPPSRRPLVAVAVVVVLLAGLAVAVGARPDGSGEVVTATEGPAEESTGPGAGGEPASVPEDAPASTADEPAPAPGTPLPAPGAPVLLRSKATVTQQQQQQGYSQGTITLVFDQPVEPGTAMNLVLYGDDPTCAGPAGNSHVVLSGAGTPSITFDATSLGVPTSYITIFPGFVTGTGSGAANAAVPCTRVPTEVSLAPTTTTTPGPPGPVLTGVTARVTERQGSYAQ